MNGDIFRPFVSGLTEYNAGKNPDKPGIIKLASNENPFGPSPLALEAIKKELSSLQIYPDQKASRLREALSKKFLVEADSIICGNGSDDIMQIIGATFLSPGEEAVIPNNSFSIYSLVTLIYQGIPVMAQLKDCAINLSAMAAAVTGKTKLIFLTNPHNPCGTIFTKAELVEFIRKIPENILLIIDEAYAEFAESKDFPNCMDHIREGQKNIIVLRTFSKFYGLAGLRIGYGISAPENIAAMMKVKMPFNVSRAAIAAASAALEDRAFLDKTYKNNSEVKKALYAGLDKLGLKYNKTEANFVLVEVGQADPIFLKLMSEGIIIRPLTSFGLPNAIRISIGTEEQNTKLLSALKKAI
ncbi:histidinol-phosphate transaminase [Candidatus Saganbacteria bacterium]|nr:histidinol-phosphate transaminase [Candidatus Saganbacteria bacterium]